MGIIAVAVILAFVSVFVGDKREKKRLQDAAHKVKKGHDEMGMKALAGMVLGGVGMEVGVGWKSCWDGRRLGSVGVGGGVGAGVGLSWSGSMNGNESGNGSGNAIRNENESRNGCASESE